MMKSPGPQFQEKGGILGQNIRENWEKGLFGGNWIMPFPHRDRGTETFYQVHLCSKVIKCQLPKTES